jgi:hypothetical protein
MIKALMVITMVSGTTYEVKLPSMQVCMAERTPVEVQADVASTACIPRTDNSDVPKQLFGRWLDVVLQLEKQKGWNECEFYDTNQDYYPPKP